MRRFALLPLCVCFAAPLWSGCQSTGHQTAQAARTRPGSFWSAEGQATKTELVSNRNGSAKVRFASRPDREGGSSLSDLLPGNATDRIPLPRTDEGELRDVDAPPSSQQPIGAF